MTPERPLQAGNCNARVLSTWHRSPLRGHNAIANTGALGGLAGGVSVTSLQAKHASMSGARALETHALESEAGTVCCSVARPRCKQGELPATVMTEAQCAAEHAGPLKLCRQGKCLDRSGRAGSVGAPGQVHAGFAGVSDKGQATVLSWCQWAAP